MLRIEYKAAQSRVDEAGAVDDMLTRVQRLDGTIVELRKLLDAWPEASRQ